MRSKTAGPENSRDFSLLLLVEHRLWRHQNHDQELQPYDHLTSDLLHYTDDPPDHAEVSIGGSSQLSVDGFGLLSIDVARVSLRIAFQKCRV
ncbi:hypothetical protein DY000_02047892 [Brassica cretica]|uniref:Uncharacterized protein n=1 Tax=Brassica cretica TaxID=69181 RepID=A0ABQ7EPM0_BRACR|nr:hypothetical protein DY000_02047892 [Brassica cretica]